ncbi:MAG: DUF5693 family protein [Candidatus Zipacnadales bacterium]
MGNTHLRRLSVILLGVGLVASIIVAIVRLQLEAANRTVALILDYDQVRLLSLVSGISRRDVLKRLKAAGATHIAITEQTLHEVLATGEVVALPPGEKWTVGTVPPTISFLGRPATIQRIQRSLLERLQLPPNAVQVTPESSVANRLSVCYAEPPDLNQLGIGYPQGAVQEVNLAGLEVVPRPRAEGNQWGAAIKAALNLAQELNGPLLLFSGNTVPGYPDNSAKAAEELRKRHLLFGYVEFSKQYGDLAVAKQMPQAVICVHSINETEMLSMSVRRAVDRFALAVRERNIRACYVRLFEPSGDDPLMSAESYVRELAGRLTSSGFVLGAPQPYGSLAVPFGLRFLAMLGAVGALGLCFTDLLGWRSTRVLLVLGAGVILVGVAALASLLAATKLAALTAAIVLPTLAVGRLRPSEKQVVSREAAFGKGLVVFLEISSLSTIGGLLIVGCLADSRFLMKLDQFSGVKLAHLLPLLGVLLLQVGWDLGSPERVSNETPLSTLMRGWSVAARSVVRYWHATLLVIGVGALAFLLLRTGNESGIGVSSLELQMRAALDRIVGVRPRTKEVLIGHPLLVLALARALSGRRAGGWVLLSLGTIGQVSITNTFCHLHTPLLISFIRTIHGLWCGILLGLILYVMLELTKHLWPPLRHGLCPPR